MKRSPTNQVSKNNVGTDGLERRTTRRNQKIFPLPGARPLPPNLCQGWHADVKLFWWREGPWPFNHVHESDQGAYHQSGEGPLRQGECARPLKKEGDRLLSWRLSTNALAF